MFFNILLLIVYIIILSIALYISPISKKKYIPIKIKPDGNCFFRAISASLNDGNQNFHSHYRILLYKSFLKYPVNSENSEFMSNEELKFIKNLKYRGTWIDSQLAILRLSDILQRDILFLGFNKIYNRKKFKKKKPIYLIWHTNIHYDLHNIVTDSMYNNKLNLNL